MKKPEVFLIVFLISFPLEILNGQTKSGNYFLGADGRFSLTSRSQETEIMFSPKFGYSFNNSNFTGIQIDYRRISSKNMFEDKTLTIDINVGGFDRCYFGTGKVKPYIEFVTGYGAQGYKYTYNNQTTESKTEYFYYGGSLGNGVFLNENISLDFGVNYNFEKEKSVKAVGELRTYVGFVIIL